MHVHWFGDAIATAPNGARKTLIIPQKIQLLMRPRYKEILKNYFPEETLGQVISLVEKHSLHLTFTRERITKLGDYRSPAKSGVHKISLNGNLPPFFLYLVFLHEIAHLQVWVKYQHRVSPHGKQWKEEFGSLLQQAIHLNLVPENLRQAVQGFCKNIKATFASDATLWRALKDLDPGSPNEMVLEDLPINAWFKAANGKVFRKEEKLRTRYRCFCATNNRRYLFHPFAEIQPLQEQALRDEPHYSNC